MNHNPFSLENKVVLVTGASSGIGSQCAIDCSKMGARVVLIARNEERLMQTLSQMEGFGHIVLPFDLSSSTGLKEAIKDDHGAKVFGYSVDDPRPFGVVEFDENGQAVSIEEKPKNPKSNYIVPGLYFYDNQVIDIAKNLEPSARGEYEITDVNLEYLSRGQLKVIPFDRGLTWMDAGTADSMLEAAEIVKALQKSGCYVGCLEELAWKEGFVSLDKIHEIGESLKMTNYGQYLLKLK